MLIVCIETTQNSMFNIWMPFLFQWMEFIPGKKKTKNFELSPHILLKFEIIWIRIRWKKERKKERKKKRNNFSETHN